MAKEFQQFQLARAKSIIATMHGQMHASINMVCRWLRALCEISRSALIIPIHNFLFVIN